MLEYDDPDDAIGRVATRLAANARVKREAERSRDRWWALRLQDLDELPYDDKEFRLKVMDVVDEMLHGEDE